MFPSLSSCAPSALVTTSFTVKEKQTLVINQPVKVVGPNVYFVQNTLSDFNFYINPLLLTSYNFSDLHLLMGRTYIFSLGTMTNEPFYITTTAGVEYKTGVRYTNYKELKESFIYPSVVVNTVVVGAVPTSVFTIVSAEPIAVFVQPVMGARSFYRPGTDYSTASVGNSYTFTFTLPVTNVTVFFVLGGLFYLQSWSFPSQGVHTRSSVVTVDGVSLTPSSQFEVGFGGGLYYLGIFGVFPAGSLVTIQRQPGMEGKVFFTPSATTPNTLQIRNRKTNAVQATLRITPNGTIFPLNTQVVLKENEIVSCSITAPATHLSYNYYEYFLGGMQNYFAVVTKNNYTPLVKVSDREKRYFNYVNYYSGYSLLNSANNEVLYVSPTGLGHGSITGTVDFNHYHVVLDVVNYKVNLYTGSGGLRYTVVLPDFPIEYHRFKYLTGTTYATDLAVLCADGIIYRIKSNLTWTASQKFSPATLSLAFLNSNLPINEDIPFLGSFTDAARQRLVASLFPVVTSFTLITGTPNAYLVGSTSLARMNLNTGAVYSTISLATLGPLLSISYHDYQGVIVTTKSHRIWYVANSGVLIDLTPPGGPFVFGTPSSALFDRAGRTFVPDAHNRRIVVINGVVATDRTYINLGDFVPAYCKRLGDSDTVYVTGHDTNRVIKIKITDPLNWILTETSASEIAYLDFSKKVTLVSALNNSILGHHYLENRTTLDFGTSIKKVIPLKLDYREGPSSSIGTTPIIIRMVGYPNLTPIAGPYVRWWVNGQFGADLTDGAYLGVNYRGSAAGIHRSFIILGEHALDYDTKTVAAISYLDHYQAGVFGTNFLSLMTATYVPPTAAEGVYVLPFDINYFGTLYTEFLFSAQHGIISLDTSFPLGGIVPNFSSATTDALLVEPRSIYIDRPIDNSDVSNVQFGTIAGGKTPGVYYEQGIVGEFVYYKWRAVGTTPVPLPNGFVRISENLSQTGVEINMVDFSTVAVADFVSNPIVGTPPYAVIVSTGPVVGTPSCTVVAVTPYAMPVISYFALGNQIYLTTPAVSYKKYAKITSAGGISYDWSNNVFTNVTKAGNAVLSVNTITNKVIVEGLTDLAIINKDRWIFEFTTTKVSTTYQREYGGVTNFGTVLGAVTTSTVDSIIQATNIQHILATFSPVDNSTASNLIQVDQATYNKITVGQTLTSLLFGGTDIVTGKITVPRTFNLIVTPSLAWEGISGLYPPTEIYIDLKVNPIPDGTFFNFAITGGKATITGPQSDFDSTWRAEWPGTALPPSLYPASNSINIPIYNNWVRLVLPVKADLIPFSTEKVEDYFVVVSTIVAPIVSLGLGNAPKKLLIGNTLSGTPVNADPIINNLYYIQVSGTYNASTTDVIASEATEFTFSSIPAGIQHNVTVTNPITNGLDGIFGTDDDERVDDVYTVTMFNYKQHIIETINNFAAPINGVLTTLNITGNFLEFSVPQTLPALTPILFKPVSVHPSVEFELAFYKGRNFQYIEYNYIGPPDHNNTLTVGLRDDTNTYSYQIAGTPPGIYSHLFGGEYADGIFYNIGPGQFTHIPLGGFVPRQPRIYRERVFNDSNVRYDIYIDQKIPALVDLRASLDYGYLRLNDGLYDGTKKIEEGDILTVIVPFQGSFATSSVILSLAQSQFAIPVARDTLMDLKQEFSTLIPNQPIIENINISFNVFITGDYMIPDYFSSASGGGAEMIFERWNGATFIATLPRGSYVPVFAGDTIRVNNVFTGYRNFNTVELIFAGPAVQKVIVETTGKPDLVTYLNFGKLDKPYTMLERSSNLVVMPGYTPVQFLPYSNLTDIPQFEVGKAPFLETFSGHENYRILDVPFYESRSFPVTLSSGTLGTPVTLFSDQLNVTFISGSVRTDSNVTTLLSGDLVGLEWDLYSYHAANSKIYQITIDSLDGSEIYTEVGTWEIVNKQLEPLLINGEANSGRSVNKVDIISGGLGYDRNNIAIDFDPPPAGGSKPAAIIILDTGSAGIIEQVILTSGGSGYLTPPNIYFIGPNIVPAVATAFLVENVMPHETELKLANSPSVLQYSETANAQPAFTYFTQNAGINLALQTGVLPLETHILKSTVPLKPSTEFTYITSPQPSYAVFLAETLFSQSLEYQFAQQPTFYTDSPLVQTFQFNIFSKQLQFGNVITGNPITTILQNVSNVLPAATSISTKMPNFEKAFLANFFTGSSTYQWLTYSRLTSPGSLPFVDMPYTIFGSTTTYKINIQPSELAAKQTTELIPQTDNILGKTPNYEKNLQFTHLFSETALFDLYKITELTSETALYDLDFYTLFSSDPLEGEFQNTQDYYKGVGFEFDFFNIFFGTMPDPTKDDFTVLYPEMPDADKNIYTVFLPPMPDPVQSTLQPAFLPDIGGEFARDTILFSNPAEYFFGLGPTIMTDTNEFRHFDFNILLLEIEEEFVLQEKFLPPITSEFVYQDKLLTEVSSEWDYIERAEILLPPEWIYQDKLFPELPPEWIYQDKLFPELPPEWIYQDKLFPELPPEWIYQDKLFPELPPEWIYQDKLFPEFPPEWIYQDKLFVDLIVDQPDPGNRYFDFMPLLGDSGNRYIEFLAEWIYQDKLFTPITPEMPDPGNRYLDFPAKLIGDPSPLIDFPPELLFQDKLFIELTSYRLSEEKAFLEWNPKLDHLNVQYQDGYDLYGAFKTEFLIFADQGRGGDLGQYQGTPPGTIGRTNIPILSYREFKGSALLKYSPFYGLGGFSTQAGAQVVADKYVNATTIQVPVAGFYNYRIHFNQKTFYPRKSRIFPTLWYVRGA